MGSKDKYFGVRSASHGFDDIGYAQPSGSISSVARYGGAGKWRKMAVVTASAPHNLTNGQAVNIAGTTDYDGPTIVLDVVSSTQFLIKRPFTVTKTGTFDCKAGEGNWDAMIPLGADIPAGNLAFSFWKPEMNAGNETGVVYTKDELYTFPGGIRRAIMSTAGTTAACNARLIRASSLRPGGVKSKIAPTVIFYSPTGATAGDSVDILGSDFDPALSNNSVHFIGGGTATVVNPTAVDPEGHWMTVPFPSGVINTTGAFRVKTNGLLGATGPSVNVR